MSEIEAMRWLTIAAESNVDEVYQKLASMQIGGLASREAEALKTAKQFIQINGKGGFVDDRGVQKKLFHAKNGDFQKSAVYSEYRNNKDYRDFYWKVIGDNLLPDKPTPQELAVYKQREKERIPAAPKGMAIQLIPGMMGIAAGRIRPTPSTFKPEYDAVATPATVPPKGAAPVKGLENLGAKSTAELGQGATKTGANGQYAQKTAAGNATAKNTGTTTGKPLVEPLPVKPVTGETSKKPAAVWDPVKGTENLGSTSTAALGFDATKTAATGQFSQRAGAGNVAASYADSAGNPLVSALPVKPVTAETVVANATGANITLSAGQANTVSGLRLRESLAREAGIPRGLENVWGSRLSDLKATYQMDGYTVVDKAAHASSSGNAKIFKVEGNPLIKEVQHSPSTAQLPCAEQSQHIGEYYKFTYQDGSQVKVIDPQTYKMGAPENRTRYFNQQGQSITYDPATRTWKNVNEN